MGKPHTRYIYGSVGSAGNIDSAELLFWKTDYIFQLKIWRPAPECVTDTDSQLRYISNSVLTFLLIKTSARER